MLVIAYKTVLELIREPKIFLLVILLPIFFLTLYTSVYGGPVTPTYSIMILDKSGGWHTELLDSIRDRQYKDGRNIFEIKSYSNAESADTALKTQTITVVATINSDQSGRPIVSLRGDATNQKYNEASMQLTNIANDYIDKKFNRRQAIRMQDTQSSPYSPQNNFDIGAPGMIVFAILLIIPQTALLVSRETRLKTLRRIRISRINTVKLFSGFSLAQMVVALVQALLILAFIKIFGGHIAGSLILATAIVLLLSFSAIGIGFVLSCFVSDDNQASNVGGVLAMIIVFLSGAFFPIPKTVLFYVKGHSIGLFDFLPATHGVMALQNVLTYGYGLHDLAFNLVLMVLLSIIVFFIGVFTFQKLKMSDGV